MRIALVHPYCWPEVRRGAERYVDDLSSYLASRGHEVHVVTGSLRGARLRTHTVRRPDGVLVHTRRHVLTRRAQRAGIGATESFGAQALAQLLPRRVDLVHAFTPSAAIAGRLARKPTLYTVLGHPDPAQLPAQHTPRTILRAAARMATTTAALSEASAGAAWRTLRSHAMVLPPGIRTERFSPDLSARRGPVRLLFSASLEDRRKRADLAVAAFALILDRHPDARLVLSGTGDPSWALTGTPARVRDGVDVLGAGRPEDVPARYRDATVTVLSAEHEAFGLVLLESLASGTPAVCLPSGGAPEILGSGAVGRVASSCSAAALAKAAEHAIELARRDGTASHCVARALQWDWGATVGPAHERAYAGLAGAPTDPHAGAPSISGSASRGGAATPGHAADGRPMTRRRQSVRTR